MAATRKNRGGEESATRGLAAMANYESARKNQGA